MDSIKLLKKTIPFKWRVQSAIPRDNPTHVQLIAYVDARDVMEQLDQVVGAENWTDNYKEIKGIIYCSIGIKVDGEWVYKTDCGTESKTEKEKGESSDAFKRAAVKWGINRDAYRVGMVKLPCKKYGSAYFPTDDRGNFLKGQDLFDKCNKLAKIEDLENYNLEIEDENGDIHILFDQKKESLNKDDYEYIEKSLKENKTREFTKIRKILQSI